MAVYPLDNSAISFNELRQSLINFVQSKPDASRWRDFYTGGEGTILIELIAGLGFYEALKIIFSKEETYLQYVNTLASAKAVALNYTYSAFRGKNRRYTLRFTPNRPASIPAFSIIGYQGDYDLVTTKDVLLNEGTPVEVEVIVGTFMTSTLEATSANLEIFRFTDDLVSEDYRLYLNDVQMPTTSLASKALEDNYLVQSNSVGGVNVTYLNTQVDFEHKYQTGDQLRLDYIQYQNIEYSTELSVDYADEVEVLTTTNPEYPETIQSIQVKAPIMYETQQLVRAREDYTKNLKQLKAKFTDAQSRDLSPAYVEVTYAQNDRTLLTDEEREDVLQQLSKSRTFGVPMAYLNEPKYSRIKLDVNLRIRTAQTALELEPVVEAAMDPYEYVFGKLIDFTDIKTELQTNSAIRIATITNTEDEFRRSDYYQLGDVISLPKVVGTESTLYRVVDFVFDTDSTEPSWNPELYSYTEDKDVIWQAVPETGHPEPWQAGSVLLYDTCIPATNYVRGIMYRVVKGKSVSSPTAEPEWKTTINEITEDHEIIWQSIPYIATADSYKLNHWYNVGEIANSSTGTATFQVIGIRRRSGNVEPEWSGEQVIYNNMVLAKENTELSQLELGWGTYCTIETNITVSEQ